MKKLVIAAAAMFAASLFAEEATPPANDYMENAEAISGESGSVQGTCEGATRDGDDDPLYAEFRIENSVWYKWTAPAAGNFKFRTTGAESEADTVLCVCSADGKNTLVSNDDINDDDYGSKVTVQAKAGTEYLIGVGEYVESDCEDLWDEQNEEWHSQCRDVFNPFVLNWSKAGDTGTVKIVVEPWDDESAGGKASGAGTFKIGKKTTLKAVADKGSAFAGWYVKTGEGEDASYECLDDYLDEDTDWRNPSFPYTVEDDEELEVVAQFATAEEDSDLSVSFGEWVAGGDYGQLLTDCAPAPELVFIEYGSINVDDDKWQAYDVCRPVGFSMYALRFVHSVSLPKLAVKGLPPGLKYDAKTGYIKGEATKPGVYKVTFSATNATVKKPVEASIDFIVPNLSCEALPNLMPETDAYGTFYAGGPFDAGIVDCTPAEGWTVKAAGLPAGLSFKDDTISGVPSKPGVYTVTFTATKGKEKQTATITLNVEAMPLWAEGIFTGWVDLGHWNAEGQNWSYNGDRGFATITVGANGKTSGKVSLNGTNYTFSASGYSHIDAHSDYIYNEATDSDEFISVVEDCGVSGELKSGKTVVPVTFWIGSYSDDELPAQGKGRLQNAYAFGGSDEGEDEHEDGEMHLEFYLYRNIWKDKAKAFTAKAVLAKWEGVYTVSMDNAGYLSLTVGKDGTVKASGKLGDGTAVSAASPLMYDPWDAGGYFATLYAAPSAYKGGSFNLQVNFGTERGALSGSGDWVNRNPTSTGDYGEVFWMGCDAEGAYYDKNEKLNDYYETLRFKMDEAPALYYTFKETYFDDDTKKKVTGSYIADAYAADTLGQDGCTVGVNDKGFVVAKATKPVKDKDGVWHYSGTNDGALTLSFAQATGIFKGSYTFWYDYVSAYDGIKEKETTAHTSKKVAFEGVWVQGSGLKGCIAAEAMSSYTDPKTNKEKTYKFKDPILVELVPQL